MDSQRIFFARSRGTSRRPRAAARPSTRRARGPGRCGDDSQSLASQLARYEAARSRSRAPGLCCAGSTRTLGGRAVPREGRTHHPAGKNRGRALRDQPGPGFLRWILKGRLLDPSRTSPQVPPGGGDLLKGLALEGRPSVTPWLCPSNDLSQSRLIGLLGWASKPQSRLAVSHPSTYQSGPRGGCRLCRSGCGCAGRLRSHQAGQPDVNGAMGRRQSIARSIPWGPWQPSTEWPQA